MKELSRYNQEQNNDKHSSSNNDDDGDATKQVSFTASSSSQTVESYHPPSPLSTSICEICHIDSHKYHCPSCLIKFCSLKCFTLHKSPPYPPCTGIRDKTKCLNVY